MFGGEGALDECDSTQPIGRSWKGAAVTGPPSLLLGTQHGVDERAGPSGVEWLGRHQPEVEDRAEKRQSRQFWIDPGRKLARRDALGDDVDEALASRR